MTNCFTIFYNFTKYVRNVIFLKKIQMLEFSIYARLAEYKELTVFNSLGLLTSEIRHRAKLFYIKYSYLEIKRLLPSFIYNILVWK